LLEESTRGGHLTKEKIPKEVTIIGDETTILGYQYNPGFVFSYHKQSEEKANAKKWKLTEEPVEPTEPTEPTASESKSKEQKEPRTTYTLPQNVQVIVLTKCGLSQFFGYRYRLVMEKKGTPSALSFLVEPAPCVPFFLISS